VNKFFTNFINIEITKNNYKSVWGMKGGDCIFNTGNYIFSKSLYVKSTTTEDLKKYENTCHALDVQFKNYFLLMNDSIFKIIKDMEYYHVVHSGSYYINTEKLIDRTIFDNLYK
jgi:hypothetical protein